MSLKQTSKQINQKTLYGFIAWVLNMNFTCFVTPTDTRVYVPMWLPCYSD